MRLRTTLSGAIAVSALSAGLVRAETFDIQAVIVCPTSDPLCGFASLQKMKDGFDASILEVNREFGPTGISYHPLPPIVVVDDNLASINASKGMSANGGSNTDLIDQILHDVVAPHPDRVWMVLKNGLDNCWNALPCPDGSDPAGVTQDEVVFCGLPNWNVGRRYAHELGHYWCLAHTHTLADAPESSPVDRDGDDERCWDALPHVTDTPADPGPFEAFRLAADGTPVKGRDEREDGTLIEKHEFCNVTKMTDVDPGSAPLAHGSYCDIGCVNVKDGAEQPTSFLPLAQNIMSYHKPEVCRGPYVIGGTRFEAITSNQVAVVHACRAKDDNRKKLIDICKSKGGDSDHDGWCNAEDKCPNLPNVSQSDTDGDGIPDACDLCNGVKNSSNQDTDMDGIGDVCDPDIDNDGCANEVDQHPDDAFVPVGKILYPLCIPSVGDMVSDESIDTDDDGIADCADQDDDNDDIPDDLDECVISANPIDCLEQGDSCALQTVWGRYCEVFGCQYFDILVQRVNPDPTIIAVFEKMDVHEDVIYLSPVSGYTMGESAAMLLGTASMDGRGSSGELMLVMRNKRDGSLTRLGSFDPERVRVGDLENGQFLRLDMSARGAVVALKATWSVGDSWTSARVDADRDGRPDFADNCTMVPNVNQADTDGDRFGDACDADLDQSFYVDGRDVELAVGCLGVDLLTVFGPPMCEGGEATREDPREAHRQAACANFDLDRDGYVGERDLEIVRRSAGGRVGPSGVAVLPRR